MRHFILVAEDDPVYNEIYKVKLQKAGFEVEVVVNGQELMDFLRTRIPDLILLDLVMPVKSGFEVLQELKQDPEKAKIKVIVISNLGHEEDRDRLTNLGVSDYILKANTSIQEVIIKIKECLLHP